MGKGEVRGQRASVVKSTRPRIPTAFSGGNRGAQKPLLFLSHATGKLGENHRSVRIREALYASLTARGWEVFLDRKHIQPGDEWRLEILEALAEAQAGVVLFDLRAVSKSRWVSSEAQILCFRKSIDPGFQFIPMLLGGAKLEHTCFAQYEPFRLQAIHAETDDTKRTPEEMAKHLATLLPPPQSGRCESSQWVSNVVSVLQNIQEDVLDRAATHLKISAERRATPATRVEARRAGQRRLPFGIPRATLLRACAEIMHHELPAYCLPAFRELLRDSNLEKDRLKKHLTAKWVPNEATEMLLCASRRPDTLGLLGVNTGRMQVVEQYRLRMQIELAGKAACVFTVSAPPGEGDEFLLKHVERTFQQEILQHETYSGENYSDLSVLDAVTRHIRGNGQVTICILPWQYAGSGVLGLLRKRYAQIVFLVQLGFEQAKVEQFVHIGGTPLRPSLNEERHNELAKLSIDLETAIKNSV